MRTIELHGGPLDGTTHQLKDPFGMGVEPEEIGIPTGPLATDPAAWYRRDDDGAYRFVRIETRADDKAMATAKEIENQWGDLKAQASKQLHDAAHGDWFGPSIDDIRDAGEWFTSRLADIIRKGMG